MWKKLIRKQNWTYSFVKFYKESESLLVLDGNRKEALKDFVKEVEETIEHHILKQGDCSDQLSGFFDTRMKTLLQVSRFSLIYVNFL